MPIEWNSSFSTNDARIDEQHRQIFRFTNRLEELAKSPNPDRAEADSLLRFLDAYIQNHFRYEEACMLKRHCPVAQRNRAEHIAFRAFFEKAKETYREQGFSPEWANALFTKLENWLTNHICKLDAQLRNYP